MAWYDSSIFYHMYPLGMVGAKNNNEEGPTEEHFPELIAYIPYLKILGCNAIYIGPLFESETHGYDTIDYKKVDRRLGANTDFKNFVSTAHNYGMKVIVDAVFNHTGRKFFAFQDLLKNGHNSAYRSWYKNVEFGAYSPKGDPFRYSCWRGIWELPELNFYNEDVRRYLIEVVRFWVNEFDIDGLRLDCADVLDINFQKSLRYFTKEMKPEFWLLGEVIHGEYGRWVNPNTLHSLTNYELHKSLYSGFNDHNFFEISHNLKRNIAIAKDLYNFVENHDVDRLPSKLNNRLDLKPCYMALFTLPGHPSIYYGGEFALEGKKKGWDDSPMRPPINLDSMKPNEFTSFIAKLAEIRGKNTELNNGSFQDILLRNRQWAYARTDLNSSVITALNNDDHPADFTLTSPLHANVCFDLISGDQIEIGSDNKLNFKVGGHSGRLIKVKM